MTESKSEGESLQDTPSTESTALPVEGQESATETQSGGSSSSSQGKKSARSANHQDGAGNSKGDSSHQEDVVASSEDQPAEEAIESVDAADADGTEDSASVVESDESITTKVLKNGYKNLRGVVLIAVVIVGLLGFFLVSRGNNAVDLTKVQGNVALSEQELRDIVSSNHLTAYWAGPVDGDKYTIVATTPGLVYIKYLPGGVGVNDMKTPYRTVGTYVWKNAFAVAQYMRTTPGHAGLLNADGNAVFYATAVGTRNVYLGIKGKDIEVEVFDPIEGEALGLALVKNGISQIK